ncbi:hypothetical protein [Actinobacillus pleuropneumoniae]|uniref:Uncharacterized protein n=1 Tax=Actinobacillus pleuropneumoniae serotype 7 (strain AP76) TaxID=537457 RepID=B3GXK6_ACTP7|nr:hypothetical protein [Actinobacillus pleuropneumoniae]ACE61465.1 hypothetical protein APP7_0813 [Actinobacillus pleuropneumoniae serovar 7 str. AP76]EFN03021.1 hypothetical protein appser13_8320 [Actinobacillus pleuropneumoniae serovar 13 str. N273]UKH38914.1 hypothetical protein D1100_04095 [Actinobacillus pleuropneumoniae]UQZ26435.1 hypothetical protein M6G44_03875 [Actinobacillus pleuropneumoniae]
MKSIEAIYNHTIESLNNINTISQTAKKEASEGKDFIKHIISRVEEGKSIDFKQSLNDDLNSIPNIIKVSNERKNNLIRVALLNSGAAIQQIDNFIDTLNKFNEIEEFGIKTIINTKIKSTIEYVDKRIKYNNSIEGYFNGKKPKPKSTSQCDAEQKAAEIWAGDKMLSIQKVAEMVQYCCNITETIETIKRWIKPFDPLKGTGIKRKRQKKNK